MTPDSAIRAAARAHRLRVLARLFGRVAAPPRQP
jgi:hypothetical protein